jgi:diguanylate cyclase (GGDEF)-like protein
MLSGVIFPSNDPVQTHRIRRFLMGAAASLMVLLLLALATYFGILPQPGFVVASTTMIALVIVFFVLFRLGVNKRFADPSLTLAQIIASTVVILYCLYESPRGHGILALIYMVSFLFGVFRLLTRELLGLTGFVAVSYGLILALQARAIYDVQRVQEDFLRWMVLVAVLTFFSVMGGYLSKLRKNLSDANARLENAMLRIEHLAARDELTGVFNRRTLVDILTQQKSRATRYGTRFSILMIDIDFFKRVNDTHGHLAGDTVLARFASAGAASLRQTDTFGRYGGEEFLAVLDQTELEGACIVGERMRLLVRQLQFDEIAQGMRVTASIGIAEHRRGEEWKVTVERADQALYRAKQGGRDRIERESVPTK